MDPLVLKVLVHARRLIKRGWVQNTYSTVGEDGRELCYCASGAIRQAVRGVRSNEANEASEAGEDGRYGARLQAMSALAEQIPTDRTDKEGAIIDYNDQPERTRAEVLALFTKAIAAVKKES